MVETQKSKYSGRLMEMEGVQQTKQGKLQRIKVDNLWFTVFQNEFKYLHNKIFIGDYVELEYWVKDGEFGRTYKNINWIRKVDSPMVGKEDKTSMDLLLERTERIEERLESIMSYLRGIVDVKVANELPSVILIDSSKVPEDFAKKVEKATQHKLVFSADDSL